MSEQKIRIWAGPFDALSGSEQQSMIELIEEGGAILGSSEEIRARLERTSSIALARTAMDQKAVGAAALKTPLGSYRTKIFRSAGVPLTGYETAPEVGYVVVAKEMRGRGLATNLVDAIVSQIQIPTFATTDDDAMKHILATAGFKNVGLEWKGNRGKLTLWTYFSAGLKGQVGSAP